MNQFEPGECGNPNGRPKGKKNRSTLLKKWLSIKTEVGTEEDEIILGIIKKAKGGDVNAYKEIMDSLYGKIPEKIEHKEVDEFADKTNEELKEYIKEP